MTDIIKYAYLDDDETLIKWLDDNRQSVDAIYQRLQDDGEPLGYDWLPGLMGDALHYFEVCSTVAIPKGMSYSEWRKLYQRIERFFELVSDSEIALMQEFSAKNKLLDKLNRTPKPKKKSTDGYVYLIESPTGSYKIGMTTNPDQRKNHFSVTMPFEVEYVCLIPAKDAYGLEHKLHKKYASKRITPNGEWFNLSLADVEYIKRLAE